MQNNRNKTKPAQFIVLTLISVKGKCQVFRDFHLRMFVPPVTACAYKTTVSLWCSDSALDMSEITSAVWSQVSGATFVISLLSCLQGQCCEIQAGLGSLK